MIMGWIFCPSIFLEAGSFQEGDVGVLSVSDRQGYQHFA